MKKIMGCILLALIFFAIFTIMAIFAPLGVFALAAIIGGLVWLAIELIND
jgi:hypothetical protein